MEMETHEDLLQSIRDWTEETLQVLSTQFFPEQLSASDVGTIVFYLRTILSTTSSLEALFTVCSAFHTLSEVTGKMVNHRDEALELLQMMLNKHLEQASEGVDINEMLGESLGQVVERCGEGVFAFLVLNRVAGHLLKLVGKEKIGSNARRSYLNALFLLTSSSEIEDKERLVEEFAVDLGKLVDWLYTCGDYATQATLVEVLLR